MTALHILVTMTKIEDFLKYKAKNTQNNYRWIINEYFKEIKQDPDKYYYDKPEKVKQDINDWWVNHLDEVPKTRNTKLNIMKSFLEEYELLYPKKFWIKLRRMRKGTRAATMDRVPTQQEFKRLLQHGTIKDKALFLFTATSGMRIDEVLRIKPEHINFKSNPVMVTIPGHISKTGDPRITFITPETVEYLNEWMTHYRDNYIIHKKTKNMCKKDERTDTVFPFHYNVAWTRWIYLLKKSGLDEKDMTTGRYVLHIHCLRKYFLSRLKLLIPDVVAESFAGHERYLDESYRRFTKQQLGEYYLKGMENLMVFEVTPDLSEQNERITQLEKENQELTNRLEKLETLKQLFEMKQDIDELKNNK